MSEQKIKAHYRPDVFDAPDVSYAKRIILTSEGPGADTDSRWAAETPYVMELIARTIAPRSEQVVLDYGCGIGRLSKAMIEATGCRVIGVDISARMRQLAEDYVGSDRFMAMSPVQFDFLVGIGLRVHAAIAVWVLQHCMKPAEDIERIRRGMAADASFFVLNMPKRAVPATLDDAKTFVWAEDGIDVSALLRTAFVVRAEGVPDRARTPNMADAGSYWLDLRCRRT